MTKKEKIYSAVVILLTWVAISLTLVLLVPKGMEEARYVAMTVIWSLFSVGIFFCLVSIISARNSAS